VKRSALLRDVTGMMTPTQLAATREAQSGWWPSKYGADDGVVVVENLRLAEAARHHVHEFLLVISHAKLRGATGAWVAPLAIA